MLLGFINDMQRYTYLLRASLNFPENNIMSFFRIFIAFCGFFREGS